MRWSYADFCATPMPVIDEVVAWMIEESERISASRREAEAAANAARLRRR